jgi:uncharacterized protein (TIGR02266 family)
VSVYGLAILWPAGTAPDKASDLVGSLQEAFPSDKVEVIQVARLSEGANLHIRLNLSPYPRPLVERLKRDVQKAEGQFVELWRLSKDERDSFRASHLPTNDGALQVKDFQSAAREVKSHLVRLPKPSRPKPEVGLKKPAPVPVQATKQEVVSAPSVENEEPLMDFPEELDFPLTDTEASDGTGTAVSSEPPQRRWPRIPCQLDVEFKTAYDFVLEHASNICNGGIFVKTQERPAIDSEVGLKLRLPNGRILESKARVAHVLDDPTHGGVGAEFLREDPEFTQALDDYLASLK